MAITYSIDGGADAAKFNINGTSGALTFKAAPDFEAPGDANGDNVYEVSVKATDAGGLSTSKLVKVTVTDVSEGSPPQITSAGAVTVKENSTTVMTVTATDPDDGTQPPIEPPATQGTIPISFDDPMFTGMTERTSTMSLSNGQNLTKTSIKEQSGNPSITCNGTNKLTYVRVNSRECIRITGGALTIENSYLEAKGSGDDHADTLQAYSPGARNASVTLKNTHVRAYNQAATAGYFTADNWGGNITLQDVIFQGGPYGLRTIADPGCNIGVSLTNVFFVGPFGYDKFAFQKVGTGTLTITKWENVCNATISNGALVPGTPIAKPGVTPAEMDADDEGKGAKRPRR